MNAEQRKRFAEAVAMGNRSLSKALGEMGVVQNALKLMGEIAGSDVLEDGANILEMPWIGQNVREVNTDDFSNSDCGCACVAMWLAYRGKEVTVDEVSRATGLGPGFKYTLPAHLVTAAGKFGLTLTRRFFADIDDAKIISKIKAEIDRGQPAIVLVHYASLPKRYDQKFQAGHWIVVTGYDTDEVFYNDPLWQDLTGKDLSMPWAAFLGAMSDCKNDGNTQYQGLVLI